MTRRRNLSNNKGAMLALKFMAKCGLSTGDIRKELHRAFGNMWSTRTVSRWTNFTEAPPVPVLPPSPPRKVDLANRPVLKKRTTVAQTTEAILKNHFKDTDPDELSFGELTNYTASFFERMANLPWKTQAPQEWWNSAKDKAVHWYQVRGRTRSPMKDLDGVQTRAYDYCIAMYRMTIDGWQRGHRAELSCLYREWRLSFVSQMFGVSLLDM